MFLVSVSGVLKKIPIAFFVFLCLFIIFLFLLLSCLKFKVVVVRCACPSVRFHRCSCIFSKAQKRKTLFVFLLFKQKVQKKGVCPQSAPYWIFFFFSDKKVMGRYAKNCKKLAECARQGVSVGLCSLKCVQLCDPSRCQRIR